MRSAAEYIGRTESAVRRFFETIDSYVSVLRGARVPVLVTERQASPAELDAWLIENADALKAVREAQRQYFDEAFALATTCGSVLQVAAKAFELFSSNGTVPSEWAGVVRSKYACYCVGRLARRVPLGLIVLAGRNQHMHFLDAKPLREPNVAVFERLTIYHGRSTDPTIRDAAFDLTSKMLVSFAHNITALLGWRSYGAYEKDMKETLESAPER